MTLTIETTLKNLLTRDGVKSNRVGVVLLK